MPKAKTENKLTGGIIAIIILVLCLTVTTFALVYATVLIENNLFTTGNVKINLNDGKPVIQQHEFLFEPGMTVEKSFFIENESSCDVYYRIYLESVSGGLADALVVTVKDGDKTLYSDTVSRLTRENVIAADDYLKIGQRKDLTVIFRYPKDSGNEAQGYELSFTMCAEATQLKNNPEKLFD